MVVDDNDMVRALGIPISIVFALTFFVGSMLAGVGGVNVPVQRIMAFVREARQSSPKPESIWVR